MSDTKSPVPPTAWRDSMHPRNNGPVQAALEALGDDVPTAWQRAHETFRTKEWAIVCRDSLHVLQQNRDLAHVSLADAQQRLAAKPGSLEMTAFVANCQAIFDTCETILSAALATCNGSNPVTIAAARAQRASLLQQARERHNVYQVRRQRVPQEEVDQLADLLDACGQDERAAEAEQEEIAALQAAADAAKGKALDHLLDGLDKRLTAVARSIASKLNPRQCAIGREYPQLVDESILAAFTNAQGLAGISAALGEGVDLDETVSRCLSPEQHQVLAKILAVCAKNYRFGESRGRRRT